MSDTDKIIEKDQIIPDTTPGRDEPDYDVLTEGEAPLEGMRYKINPDILGNRFNTVDIDLNNKEVVDELNATYPDAWASMYKDGTTYSYSAQNAYKLVRAVELFRWLHAGDSDGPYVEGESNVFTTDEENLDTLTIDKSTHRVEVPYSEFMTSTKWSEFRIPLDLMYSQDFANDVSAVAPVPHYYDGKGYAVEVVSVVVSTEDPANLTKSYVYVDQNGNDVDVNLNYLDQNGNLVPVYIPIYAPFLLESARTIRARYNLAALNRGDNGFDEKEGTWRGFSKEFLNMHSHQVGQTVTPSPYDWGNEFASGKNGFPN